MVINVIVDLCISAALDSLRHFTQAMKEIIPSSSEVLGSLSELRKWNEEFGEGKRENKRRQVWGKGRFGFADGRDSFHKDGRVAKEINKARSTYVIDEQSY